MPRKAPLDLLAEPRPGKIQRRPALPGYGRIRDPRVLGAAGRFGALDVVVNNASYGHFGMVEEAEATATGRTVLRVVGPAWLAMNYQAARSASVSATR